MAIVRSMLSFGIEASLALEMASASEGLPSGSPPPSFAATVIARASFVKSLPRRESTIAFLCLIDAHLEWPDISERREDRWSGSSGSDCRSAGKKGPGLARVRDLEGHRAAVLGAPAGVVRRPR